MRKYIFSIILISIGFVLLIYSYTNKNKTKYSETIFSKEALAFNQNFTDFIKDVENNINLIQTNFSDPTKINDTLNTRIFILDHLKNNPYITSIGFVQKHYKIVARKEGKSLIYTSDSTEIQDIVHWQRFENNKLISGWQESLEESIKQTPWYRKLSLNNNQIQWILRLKKDESKLIENNDELFYAGYSYQTGNVNSIILLEYSRINLLKDFNINSKYENINLLIQTSEGQELNLASGIAHDSYAKGLIETENDSLKINTLNHFKRFDSIDAGIFNFSFKNSTYWNAYKRYSERTGILFYILTIPNEALNNSITTKISMNLIWFALILISIGVVLLLVKKRYFYRSNRIVIPPVMEILKEDENRYLEFKSSARWDYRQNKTNADLEKVILKTLAAFGNTDGGILLIGVDDDKNILGLERDFSTLKKATADFYEIHLRNILHNLMGVKYVTKHIRMQFEICEDQKVICKIKINAADEPLFLKYKNKNGQVEEKFYVRSGNSSQEISSIADINDYINSRFKK